MEMAYLNGLMRTINMKGVLQTIVLMVLVFLNGEMDECMQDNGKRIQWMEQENLDGMTVDNILVNGRIIIKMEKDFLYLKINQRFLEFGEKEKD